MCNSYKYILYLRYKDKSLCRLRHGDLSFIGVLELLFVLISNTVSAAFYAYILCIHIRIIVLYCINGCGLRLDLCKAIPL